MGVKIKTAHMALSRMEFRRQLTYEAGRVSRSSVQCRMVSGAALAVFPNSSHACVRGKTDSVCSGRKGGLPRTSSSVFADPQWRHEAQIMPFYGDISLPMKAKSLETVCLS